MINFRKNCPRKLKTLRHCYCKEVYLNLKWIQLFRYSESNNVLCTENKVVAKLVFFRPNHKKATIIQLFLKSEEVPPVPSWIIFRSRKKNNKLFEVETTKKTKKSESVLENSFSPLAIFSLFMFGHNLELILLAKISTTYILVKSILKKKSNSNGKYYGTPATTLWN